MRGRVCHSLTRLLTPVLVRFVTAGYAVWAQFRFSPKSIGFPCAKHFGLIFSCENLTDIGQISLYHWIFSIKNESICAMQVRKITRLELKVVVKNCFIQLQARFSQGPRRGRGRGGGGFSLPTFLKIIKSY